MSQDNRIEMNRICVDHLVKESGNLYPRTDKKILMAKGIITAFPVLAWDGPGSPYMAFYNSTGVKKGYLRCYPFFLPRFNFVFK